MPPKGRQGAAKKVRRKEKKNVAHGHAHIKSTFNNTIVSITDYAVARTQPGPSLSATTTTSTGCRPPPSAMRRS
jgi:hypothetical protein